MPVTLDTKEIDEFLQQGHTLILTSNGRDGFPHAIPLWYGYIDGEIMFRKLKNSQGALNISRDNRVCCLVETGDRWVELRAVMIRGYAVEVIDRRMIERFQEESERKYAAFRPARASLPERTQQHYSQGRVLYRVVPGKKVISWWNQKLRMNQGPAVGR